MLEKIRLRYQEEGRVLLSMSVCWPKIEAGFPFHRVADIDKDKIEAYQTKRLNEDKRRRGPSIARCLSEIRAQAARPSHPCGGKTGRG
jgi:hypothetical protein